MEYSIVEENKDPRDATIQKLGVVVTFSYNDIERHEASLQKILKELKGKSDFEAAKMANIEQNHPFVLTMSEQDMFTAHMYQECKAIVKVSGPKIAEIEKQLKEYADEKAEIIKQLPSLQASVAAEVDKGPVPPEAAAEATAPATDPAEPVESPLQREDL